MTLVNASLPAAAAPPILFESDGDAFSPRLRLWPGASARVEWRNSDGARSSELEPAWSWGAPGSRWHSLRVTPWSAVQGLVFGYDGSDSGGNYLDSSWHKAPTSLRSVRNLQSATHLDAFAASYTPLIGIDVHGMRRVRVVDCFGAESIATANLGGCSNLRRLCFEGSSLTELDTRTLHRIEDIRAAIQQGGALTVLRSPATWENLWHLCVRDQAVTGIDDVFSGALSLPAMAELYVWGDSSHPNRTLSPTIPNPTCREIQAFGSGVSVLDLTNVRWASSGGTRLLNLRNSPLVSVTLGPAQAVQQFELQSCGMSQALVDSVLAQVEALGSTGISLNLTGNAAPSAAGLLSRDAIEARGGNVTVTT